MNRLFWKFPCCDRLTCRFASYDLQNLFYLSSCNSRNLINTSTVAAQRTFCYQNNISTKNQFVNKQLIAKAAIHSSTKNKDPNVAAKPGPDVEFVKAWDVDFKNTEDAFKSKSTFELFKALLVFHLCNSNYLVSNGLQVS